MNTTLIPCCYLAPISHYSTLYHGKDTMMEVHDYYTKQTFRNRCLIDSPSGALALSIPIVKTEGKTKMLDIRISEHGNWRHQHWNALQSSYRQSPFFEYYADDFAPFYEKKWEFLADFNEEIHHLVCSLLDIAPCCGRTTAFQANPFDSIIPNPEREYYQVFAHKHGFLSGLSIADLLFNMGPESVLYL